MRQIVVSVIMTISLSVACAPLCWAQEPEKSSEKSAKATTAKLEHQLDQLKDAAARSGRPCIRATYIALRDTFDRFLDKVSDGDVFQKTSCTKVGGSDYDVLVYFDCPPNQICLIKPIYMVHVNLETGSTSVEDPYIPSDDSRRNSSSDCGCGQKRHDSDIGDLEGIVNSVLDGLDCYATCSTSSGCNNSDRCFSAKRKLRNFLDNPNRDTVQDLSDFIHSSSMNEKCMRCIVKRSADWDKFLEIIAAILAS